jgi:hypothetical protein
MRVTIVIEDAEGSKVVHSNEVSTSEGSQAFSSTTPPAEILEAARAMGAQSAGAAPALGMASMPGMPSIPDSIGSTPGEQESATAASAEGAAPGFGSEESATETALATPGDQEDSTAGTAAGEAPSFESEEASTEEDAGDASSTKRPRRRKS